MLCPVSAKEQSSTINVEEMVKNIVATRPRRPRSGRVIAGVAAGIGRRYAIDPVIVRVALVVSAIYGGAGFVVYLLGWLLLAAEEDEVSPIEALLGRGRSSMSKGFTLLLCILLIPASSGFVFGGHFSTVAGGIVLAGGLFLLHRYRGELGQVDSPVTPANAEPGAGGMSQDTTQAGPQDAVPPEYRSQPPAWDPLGAAPFAWDLPEPSPTPTTPPPAPVRRRRSRLGLATLCVLLVTGATLGALSSGNAWLTAPHILGVLAGITGVALVVGAFTHTGRGLISLAILLSLGGIVLSATDVDGWHGIGNATFTPATSAAVLPVYQHSVGNMTVNLAQVRSGNVVTSVDQGVGNVTVIVPDDATVHATCSTSMGDVECLGLNANGANDPTVHSDQTGSGATIDLKVHNGLGKVTVLDRNVANVPAAPQAPDAGNLTYTPAGVGDVHPTYQRSVGDVTLDLSKLTAGNVTTSLNVGTGDATVIVPDDATVHALCGVSDGAVDCLGSQTAGTNNVSTDGGQKGTGPTITLQVEVGTGQVSVVNESGDH